ncbi:wax ester/triacylglycerol synthase domain-containing protein, partial [Gordonia sp. (in: high G+C Gram-positive bacteria)]|uniref:wax ester/triacylglycerol synthase domain-containing protein n=1 Tax=Gordonia sp. (in: high G+C Gram-positive bacteria) TaxID=84139 RepID=UPI0039E55191
MTRLHPVDARMLWAAPRARSDQFLLFAFDDTGDDERAVAQIGDAAAAIPRLGVVAREVPGHLDYPYWTASPTRGDRVVRRGLVDRSWSGLLASVGELIGDQLDPTERAWRVHVFGGVEDPVGGSGPLRIAVLQISHALADGTAASALARRLFGDTADDGGHFAPTWHPGIATAVAVARLPVDVAATVVDGARAYRLARRGDE